MNLERFTRLDLPVPPMFEQALGYGGDARFVAFYWEPAGDELRYTDGRAGADGEHHPWLLWERHIAVAAALFGYDFGGSDAPAKHWLLLDREERRFYVGGAERVGRFFSELPEAVEAREAWEAFSPEERQRLQAEAWESLRAAMERMPEITVADIEKRMREAHRLYRKLALWLDQQPLACPACGGSCPAGAWSGGGHACPSCGRLYLATLMERKL